VPKREQSLVIALTYHSVSDGPAPLCVSAQRFERQLTTLLDAGFRGLALETAVAGIESSELPAGRWLCLTFDDAYRDFRDAALPVLQRLRLPATLFVTTSPDRQRLPGGIDRPLLGLEDLGELVASNVEIGAHSRSHVDLTTLSDADLERETVETRRLLERHAGSSVEALAYPFGRHDARVRTVVGRHFRSAWTTRLAALDARLDRCALPRIDAHYLRSPLLRALLAGGRPRPYLAVRGWLRRLRGTETRDD
jgi:peptidoglycan/xylan/chitin deacetylase (PgdA/CDA1 family)